MQHIAIKCTYNDAGEGKYVGFTGTCSDDLISYHVQKGTPWCSAEHSPCRKHYDSNSPFKRRPKQPCSESRLFIDWEFGAGIYHNGERAGEPMRWRQVDVGKLAILTTRFPDEPEADRRIVGFFKIGEVTNEDDDQTMIYADPRVRVRLPLAEAKELFFWDYYEIKTGEPAWGSGLARYLTDEQVYRMLADLHKTISDPEQLAIVENLLAEDFPAPITDAASQPITRRQRKQFLDRKYGRGGEGELHQQLKHYIAENPGEFGIRNVSEAIVEHPFLSGDVVDILFRLQDGSDVVVEVETDDPLPGCHQALKYRVLRCATRGVEISSLSVKGLVVAWHIPKAARSFCETYGLHWHEKKLN